MCGDEFNSEIESVAIILYFMWLAGLTNYRLTVSIDSFMQHFESGSEAIWYKTEKCCLSDNQIYDWLSNLYI